MTTEEVVKALEDKLESKGFASNADVQAIKDSIEELKASSDLTEVKRVAANLEAEIAALKEVKTDSPKAKTFVGKVREAFENNEAFKHFLATGKQNEAIVIEAKSAVTIGLDNTVYDADSASQVSVTQNTGIISTIRQRILTYLGAGVSVGTLSGNKAMWIEELDEQGTPIFIGEGDDKTKLSVRYEEREKRARKIAVHGKVTDEMMRNLPMLITYIQNNLIKRVDIVTENQLFNGGDSGDNLAGIIGYATAFTGGGLYTPIATYADVFRALALQVQKANGVATAVFVKPQILAEMEVEKTNDGHYLMPPFMAADGTRVAGIRLIASNALNNLTEDFVGGDLSVVQVLFSDNLSVQIGLDGNDFTKNLKTILVEQELVQFVSANDTQVLVKGTMAAAIAALETT
jgi:hypothetical protein